MILSETNKTILRQRTQKGIWQQLYEFPLVETEKEVAINALRNEALFANISEAYAIKELTLFEEKSVIHKLSHQHLYTRFWIATTKNKLSKGIDIEAIHEFAVPVLISNFISSFDGFN